MFQDEFLLGKFLGFSLKKFFWRRLDFEPAFFVLGINSGNL